MALRSYMHSSRTTDLEGERSLHCHNFHLHDRMGRWLCSSHLRQISNGREELQCRTILSGQSKKAYLLGGISVDLLHLLSLPSAHILSDYLGYVQLRTGCFGYRFGFDNALVGGRCTKMVQGPC